MKILFKFTMIALTMTFMVCACQQKDSYSMGSHVHRVVCQDTIYRDSFIVEKYKIDTVFYDTKWLRKRFETAKWMTWTNYRDSFTVDYPDCMVRIENIGERNMRAEYHGITMIVNAYDDAQEMSLQEKYEAINQSAVTKSIADSSFLMAGWCDKDKLYFEKDFKMDGLRWMYLRVEFPSEYTWAIDPLLQYVLEYKPKRLE